MKHRRVLAASVAALTLIASACGSSSDEPSTTSGAAGSEASASEASETEGSTSEAPEEEGSESEAASGDCASDEVFCVGLVTDLGKVDDKSFNQSAWEGVQASGADQTKYVETTDTKDYA